MICFQCHRSERIIDEHTESNYDGTVEYGYTVYVLACGHEATTATYAIGPAPGKPYAGRPTAPSTRAQDLAGEAGRESE